MLLVSNTTLLTRVEEPRVRAEVGVAAAVLAAPAREAVVGVHGEDDRRAAAAGGLAAGGRQGEVPGAGGRVLHHHLYKIRLSILNTSTPCGCRTEVTCSYTVFPDMPPSLLCLTARAAPHSPPGPGNTRRPRDRQPVTTTDPPLTKIFSITCRKYLKPPTRRGRSGGWRPPRRGCRRCPSCPW